jgi:roadblock/LC7 domain-containing protein
MSEVTLEQLKQTTWSPDYLNKIIEESIKIVKLTELRADIGDELFSQLSEFDRKFIINVVGTINLGYELDKDDFERIFKYLREYEG